MALKIRLRRMGRKNAPHYRIVVAESSMPRDGRIVTSIGHYNPRTEPITLVVDRDKALGWIAKGARPTDTVNSLLKHAGVYREPSATEVAEEAVRAAAATTANAAKGAASNVGKAVGAAAGAVVEKAEDVATDVADRVEEVAAGVTGEGDQGEEAARSET